MLVNIGRMRNRKGDVWSIETNQERQTRHAENICKFTSNCKELLVVDFQKSKLS